MSTLMERNIRALLEVDPGLADRLAERAEVGPPLPSSPARNTPEELRWAHHLEIATPRDYTLVILGLEPVVSALSVLERRLLCVDPSLDALLTYASAYELKPLLASGPLLIDCPLEKAISRIGRSGRIALHRSPHRGAEAASYFDALQKGLEARANQAMETRERNRREVLLSKVGTISKLGQLIASLPAGECVTAESLEAEVARGGPWGKVERLIVAMNSCR